MKLLRFMGMALICGSLLLGQTSCSMSNTGKGALIGGGGGGALGAGIGALIGGGKGAGIGAAIGAAVGAGAGTLIGHKMDKQQKELEAQLAAAKVEETQDQNGLRAIKVTFDGGILFPTGKSSLNAQAKTYLTDFAQNLNANPGTNVQILGFTDNTGTMQANQKVSTARADAVEKFLESKGVAATRLAAEGIPMSNYIATNETAEGRAQNRRVEIYITASPEMVQEAEAGTLK